VNGIFASQSGDLEASRYKKSTSAQGACGAEGILIEVIWLSLILPSAFLQVACPIGSLPINLQYAAYYMPVAGIMRVHVVQRGAIGTALCSWLHCTAILLVCCPRRLF